jgi:hypothetical protein
VEKETAPYPDIPAKLPEVKGTEKIMRVSLQQSLRLEKCQRRA